MESKYSVHREEIIRLYNDNSKISYRKIARTILKDLGIESKDPPRAFRHYIKFVIEGVPIDIPESEFERVKVIKDGDGQVLWTTDRRQTKEFVNVPANHRVKRVSTNKALGQQWVITEPKPWTPEEDEFDYLGELKKQIDGYSPTLLFDLPKRKKEGVVTITDLHFGAYISSMKINPEFNITVLCKMLEEAAHYTNLLGYKKTHVHLLGDLIESFTGLNHKNSWKGLDKGMFGVSAIKLFTILFSKHFLEKINNLGAIKIVAGNHDRTTSDNKEDVDGGAAELIAWGLELMGYDIEFSPSVIKHVVDDICYILNHGHLYLTKKTTTESICWKYGEKGMFNFVMEGHLHSRIAKLSASQVSKFTMITDDTIDTRRQVCPPMFTGNSFSEYGGWSTNPGFLITENNGRGVPHVFDYSLAQELTEVT